MDKETLGQYRYLLKEIKSLEARIKKLERVASDKVTASNSEFPYQRISVTVEGVESTETAQKLKVILGHRKDECEAARLNVERFIRGIEDSRTRLVFERRYINGWSYQKISMYLGSQHESYARKIHDAYLKSINEKKGRKRRK